MSTRPCSTGSSAISSGAGGCAWGAARTSRASATSGPSRWEVPGSSSSAARTDGLRGFANTCRHRGHELLPCGESRNLPRRRVPVPLVVLSSRRLVAPRAALRRVDARSMPEENGLVELPTEEWHGLVFVAARRASRAHRPGATSRRARRRSSPPTSPSACGWRRDHDYVVEANWKVVIENYQECYHCPMIHPELCAVSPPRSGENYPPGPRAARGSGGWMALRDDAETMSLSGQQRRHGVAGPRGPELGARSSISCSSRTCLLSLHPDYVMTHLLTPLGPGRTRVRCSWSFSPEDRRAAGVRPVLRRRTSGTSPTVRTCRRASRCSGVSPPSTGYRGSSHPTRTACISS